MENPLFEVNQKVVCVDSSDRFGRCRLIEGKVYTILGVKSAPCCGIITVDVGIHVPRELNQWCRCGNRENENTFWYRQTRFVPVDFDRYAEETFHQSLKGKPVNA